MPEPFEHSEHPTVKARMTKLAQWRKDAIIAHEYARERMKNRITENYKPFDKGQLLWLEGRNLRLGYNKKITTKREGPFVITEVCRPVNFRLQLPGKWKITNIFHTSLLTPYQENETYGENYLNPPPDVIEGQEEWEIERIFNHSGTTNRRYQVKWKGYADMTWEPEENLEHSQDSIKDYWKRKTQGWKPKIPTRARITQ